MNIHIENMYIKEWKKRLRFGELITSRAVSVGLAGQGNSKKKINHELKSDWGIKSEESKYRHLFQELVKVRWQRRYLEVVVGFKMISCDVVSTGCCT